MNLYPIMLLYVLAATMGISGVVLMGFSLCPAWRRGEPVGQTFWAPREMFTGREFVMNRLGFCLCVAAMGALLVAAYLMLG